MRLGIVTSHLPPVIGGMENHAAGLAQTLAKRCRVTVYTSQEITENEIGLPLQAVLKLKCRDDLRHLGSQNNDAWLILNAGFASLACHWRSPTFVYCHGNDFLAPYVGQGDFVEKAINATHGWPVLWRAEPLRKRWLTKYWRSKIGHGLSSAAHVFVNSTYTRDILRREYPHVASLHSKLDVSHPGVSEHFYTCAPEEKKRTASETPIRMLSIARLQPFARKKNIDSCLQALAALKDRIDFNYTIVGDGADRSWLEGLSARLGLSTRVRFVGAISNNEIPRYLDQSDLFLLPSKSSGQDIESFGIVYAEAAARGVPSLLSRSGGAMDAVKEGETAVVIEEPTAAEIADGIIRFVDDRERFDPERIRRFADQFRWETVSDQLWSKIAPKIAASCS